MKRRALIQGVAGLMSAARGSPSAAQDRQQIEQYYINGTRTVIRTVRERVKPFLTDDERRIERTINARVVSSPNFNAFARTTDGQREIYLTTAFILFLDSIARSYVAENEYGAAGCFKEYGEYFLKGLDENTRRASLHQAPRPRAYFDMYIRDSSGACSSLSSAKLNSDPRYGRAIAAVMDATIAVITLHEIAHHLLGHVSKGDVSLADSRQMEHDADIWAFDRCLKIQINPLAAEPTWMIFAAMDGTDISTEARRTHPLGLRRYLDLLRAVEQTGRSPEYANTFGAELSPETLQEIRQAITRINGQLR